MKNYLQIPLLSVLLISLYGQVIKSQKLYLDSAITYEVNLANDDSVIFCNKYYNCSSSSDKYSVLITCSTYPDRNIITECDPTENSFQRKIYNSSMALTKDTKFTEIKSKPEYTSESLGTITNGYTTQPISLKNTRRFGRFFVTTTYTHGYLIGTKVDTKEVTLSNHGISFKRNYDKDSTGNWIISSLLPNTDTIEGCDTLNDNTNGTFTIYNGNKIIREIKFDTANNTSTYTFYEDNKYASFEIHEKGTRIEIVSTREGYPVKMLYYDLDSATNTYKLSMKTDYTYDSNMNLINRTSSAFIKVYNKWISLRGHYQKHDTQGNLLQKSEYDWFDQCDDVKIEEAYTHEEIFYLKALKALTSLPVTVTLKPVYNTYYYYSTTPKDNIAVPLKNLQARLTNISQINAELGIFPNPANNETVLKLNFNPTGKAMIYNVQGQLMQTQTVNLGDNNIDLSLLQKGMYIIKVPSTNGILTGKILKK